MQLSPRTDAVRLLLVVVLAASFLATSATGPAVAASPTVWNTLVMVYRGTDVTYTWDGATKRLRSTMTSADVDRALAAAARTTFTVADWSGGMAGMKQTIVYPRNRVRSVSLHGPDGSWGYWLAPDNIKSDIDAYAPAGKYDSIIVIWRRDDDSGNRIPGYGWGWSRAPHSSTNGAGYSVVTIPHGHAPWPGTYPDEIFVHEWTHQTTSFYQSKGHPMPDIDRAGDYGYTSENGSWKRFLSDTLQGKVASTNGSLGISADAWAAGTPTNSGVTAQRNIAARSDSLTTTSNTSYVGARQTFGMAYSDPDGWRNVGEAHGTLLDSNGHPAVRLYYNQNTNRMYLRDRADSAWLGGFTPGSANTIKAAHVWVHVGASSVSGVGTQLTVKWSLTFQSAAQGAQYARYVSVRDDAGILNPNKRLGTTQVQ